MLPFHSPRAWKDISPSFMRARSHISAMYVKGFFLLNISWKDISPSFMRAKSHISAMYVKGIFPLNIPWKNILQSFMKAKSYTSVFNVMLPFHNPLVWKNISLSFMRARNHRFQITETKLMYACVFILTGYKCVETDYKLEYFSSKSMTISLPKIFVICNWTS